MLFDHNQIEYTDFLSNQGFEIVSKLCASINFCSIEILCIWEDSSTKKLTLQKHLAYLIGMNGVICSISNKQHSCLINSFAHFPKSSLYLRISQWAFLDNSYNISFGLFQMLEEVSRISEGYLGLQFHDDKSKLKPIQTDQSAKFSEIINKDLNLMTDQDSLPFIEVKSSQLMITIRKKLSQLSNFQIFSEQIVRSLVENITTQLCQSYKIRRQFQEQFENPQEFRKALQEGSHSIFFMRRNSAIDQYYRMLDLHQYLRRLIIDFKHYSSKDLQKTIRVKIIQDFQNSLNLRPLTLLNKESKIFSIKKNTYESKQETYQCIETIIKEQDRLEGQKCYLQAHILSRFLQDIALLKQTDVEQKIYLVDNKAIKTNLTKNKINFFQQQAQYKLPKVVFHSILEEVYNNKIKLCEEVKDQAIFENAMVQLFRQDKSKYQRLTNELLNEPLSRNQRLLSLQNINSLCKYTVIQDKLPNEKQTYMKYFFQMFRTLKLIYADFQFYYLQHKSKEKIVQKFTNNQIKSKLTFMHLINGYISKQPTKIYQIQGKIPVDQKFQITDLKEYADKSSIKKISPEQITSLRRINRRAKINEQQQRIKMFIESAEVLEWKDGKQIKKKRKGYLTINDFDYNYNHYYQKWQGIRPVQTRGGFPFYPPAQCTKLALRIIGKKEKENNLWLGKDNMKGEYAVAYHGLWKPLNRIDTSLYSKKDDKDKEQEKNKDHTKQPNYSNCVQNIIKTNLQPGLNQVYQNSTCLVHKKCRISQKGIYVTPSFHIAFKQYASNLEDCMQLDKNFSKKSFEPNQEQKLILESGYSDKTKQQKISQLFVTNQALNSPKRDRYSVIFMNRVNPKYIHILDRKEKKKEVPESQKNLYWVINEPENCKTIGVLLIKPIYDLISVCNHMGSTGKGHYTAYCKDMVANEWYAFDDSNVSKIENSQQVVSASAYLLFYRRRG